jgi:GT2 family glycosyltransferase
MDVSIIIVNYNTIDLTFQCLNSIFEKTKDVDFEVILVDNNSNDGSKELFRNDKRIIFIESSTNLGFGRKICYRKIPFFVKFRYYTT